MAEARTLGTVSFADRPVAGNRHAEMGLVYLALTAPDFDGSGVELLDFMYDDCRYIYGEYLNMLAKNLDPTDTAVVTSWFKRPDAIERMREHHLDWYDPDNNLPTAFADIFQLVIDGGFATLANVVWYKSEVRQWRLVRAGRYVGYRFIEKIDEDESKILEAIKWLGDNHASLIKLAESITPTMET